MTNLDREQWHRLIYKLDNKKKTKEATTGIQNYAMDWNLPTQKWMSKIITWKWCRKKIVGHSKLKLGKFLFSEVIGT